ncbi:MAG: hypothetical protein HZB51_15365 [Chloroflexi bacterium]|nr:hypothetical protein [Chloroflexota bacterium]
MLKKGGRSLIVIVILGALIFFAVSAFFAGLANDQEVVVAKVPLSAGTRLDAKLLEVKRINVSAAMPAVFTTLADVQGQLLVSARMPGDQITQEMVGDKAISALAASLPADRVAVAVKVDQASGLAGIVRVGDLVGAIGIVNAADLGLQDLSFSPVPTPATFSSALAISGTGSITGTRVQPTPKPSMPAGVAARVALYDLRVLVVPQSFRYEETAPGAAGDTFTTVRTSTSQQQNSVIVLEVPVAPIELAPNYKVSPAELLALLNDKGRLHFFLEPTAKTTHPPTSGVEAKELLEKFYAR